MIVKCREIKIKREREIEREIERLRLIFYMLFCENTLEKTAQLLTCMSDRLD